MASFGCRGVCIRGTILGDDDDNDDGGGSDDDDDGDDDDDDDNDGGGGDDDDHWSWLQVIVDIRWWLGLLAI